MSEKNSLINELRSLNSLLQNEIDSIKSADFNVQLFEELPIGLALTKETGELVYVNQAYADIIGYSTHETLQLTYWDITPQDYMPNEQEQLKLLEETGNYGPYEKHYIHKRGHRVPVRLSGRYIFKDGIRYIWSNVEDISDIKRNKQELSEALQAAEESKAIMAKVAENFPDSYVSIIHKDYTVGFTSGQEFSKLNLDPNQFVGMHLKDVFGDHTAHIILEYDKSFNGKENAFELYFNNQYQLFKTVPIFNSDGNIDQILSVVENITEQKLKEKELIEAKEKAEEGERLKAAFLANMSHEIRTPMNAILGFTNLLRKPNLTPDKHDKYIDIIHDAGNRLLDLISDIVDFSKIDSQQIELHYSCVDMNAILSRLHTQFEESKLLGEVTLTVDLLPGTSFGCLADANRMYQVFSNLLENALKFTEHGQVKFGMHVDESTLRAYVCDSGIGIPKNQLKTIFERFTQADNNQFSSIQGTGLGLSIVEGLVHLMQGEISVTSEVGVGTNFYFSIPYKPCELTDAIPTQMGNEVIKRKNLRVLLVEDDVENAEYMLTLLESLACKVTVVTNGADAITQAETKAFDAILMDLKLPVLDGISATRKIRERDTQTPIIAQTANTMGNERRDALNAGCNDFITKPITRSEVIGALNKFCP